jgi:two-component system chemotaxis response regulator CheY
MRPTKILVVDDSKLIHTMFSLVFPRVPQVHAMDGLEALRRLSENPEVDLIFLDINMPQMNGLELLQRLKQDAAFAPIPVIIVSTEGKEQDTVRGLEAGAAAYVKKPFRQEVVSDIVHRLPAPQRTGVMANGE